MIKQILFHFGRFVILIKSAISRPENMRMYWNETIRQMFDIGIGSLVIVSLISIFIGAVTALQFAFQMSGTFIPMYYIGYIVRDITIIEFAPTFTALVLAGKVGSNMASEIGGMRQKEHIDAMEVMGVNTANYLIMPKLLAAVVTIPLLVIVAAGISIFGGYLASVPMGILTHADFIKGLNSFFDPINASMMMIKAVVFGLIITSVSCYQGYFVKGGAIELGKASTNAVVTSDVLILIADYLIVLILTS